MKVFTRIGLPVVLMLLGLSSAWATSSGQVSTALAEGLYCSLGDLLEGDLGLILGLLLVFMGIWSMVQGAKLMATVPLIVVGAMVTALPSVIQAGFVGLGSMLSSAGISTHAFDAPDCTASGMTGTDDHPGKVADDTIASPAISQPSSFTPGVKGLNMYGPYQPARASTDGT